MNLPNPESDKALYALGVTVAILTIVYLTTVIALAGG